jgi:hypothetical protein
MSTLLMVLLNGATANAQRYDWVRNWDCGTSREAVWHVRIYDSGPPDRHTIYSSPNEKDNSFGREGPVDQVFYLSGRSGTAMIGVGHNPYWEKAKDPVPNPPAAIDLGRTRITCEA